MKRGTSQSSVGCGILVERPRDLLCFSSADGHGVVKQSCRASQAHVDLSLEHLLPGCGAQAESRGENVASTTNSCLGRCNLYGAIAWQPRHRMHFIEGQFSRVVNHLHDFSKCQLDQIIRVIGRLSHHCIVTSLRTNENETSHHALDFIDCDSHGALCSGEAILNTGCGQDALDSFIRSLPLLADQRNIESHDYGTARSNRCRDIPEVLGRSCCSRDDCPHAEHCQEPGRKQQPDERQLRDFPRAFHASLDFDFSGIVARWPRAIDARAGA